MSKSKLRKLRKSIAKETSVYDKHIKKAKTHEEKSNLAGECNSVLQYDEMDVDRIQTRLILNQLDRRMLPYPNRQNEEFWYEEYHTGHKLLLNAGIHEARKILHEYGTQSRQKWGFWFGIVIGLIGALTGLVSAFFK